MVGFLYLCWNTIPSRHNYHPESHSVNLDPWSWLEPESLRPSLLSLDNKRVASSPNILCGRLLAYRTETLMFSQTDVLCKLLVTWKASESWTLRGAEHTLEVERCSSHCSKCQTVAFLPEIFWKHCCVSFLYEASGKRQAITKLIWDHNDKMQLSQNYVQKCDLTVEGLALLLY